MRRLVRAGPLVFRDPLLLCGALYLLLWSDASGFLRIGLYAAVLHELGHILVYLALFRRLPVIEVTMTGLCMRTRGQALTRGQTFLLAAAGPGTNALLAAVWAVRMEQYAAIRDSAFLAANVLTGAFNLLPIPPLDGSRILLVALPQRAYFGLMKYERYIMIALLAAVWFGALDTPLYYLNNIVWELLGKGTGYIDKIAYSIYYAGLGTVV